MLDLSKAVVSVDNSEETLAKYEKRIKYSQGTDEERRAMAEAEQKAWDAEHLAGIEMP